MTMRRWGLLLVPVLLLAGGQTAAKQGALVVAGGGSPLNVFIVLGYAALLIRGLVWIVVLRDLPLSVAYPFISLSYVLVLAIAHLVFDEPVTGRHLTGTVLIVAGLSGVWWGQRRKEAAGSA
jgi:undecaprenyl phosphate-alpha-L-ara4N flippase subunit ArnE